MSLSRRQMLAGSSLAAAGLATHCDSAFAVQQKAEILMTLKIGMVRVEGALEKKFAAVKEVGFDAIEMNSPGMKVDETNAAIKASGLRVDGTVCSTHWKIRHTSADADTRAQALADLKTALRDTKAVGGDTVLLVVGRGGDGEESEIWKRSVDNISKALPLAEELDMTIAIENVWNQFLYDHKGKADQNAYKFVKYVDAFQSKHVGMQFDIGNHWAYGDTGQWIRQLGHRVVKLDSKGFSRAKRKFTKIGEGDIDWAGVRSALGAIGFKGYCAAEVGGGGTDRLAEVLANLKKTLLEA